MNGEAFLPDEPGASVRPSPNFGQRRGIERPDMVLLHYTGMATGEAAEDRLCDPAAEVSSHYVVHEGGRVVQLVRERDRAWHAGASSWLGADDINSRSVGVEIVNPGHSIGYRDFPAAQVEAVIALCRGIMARHGIPPARVLAHSDVAPGRKLDPGERFPWAALARAGVSVHVEPAPLEEGDCLAEGCEGAAVLALQEKFGRLGYGIEPTGRFDRRTAAVVEAFQRRFRPARVDGRVDPSTALTLDRALASFR